MCLWDLDSTRCQHKKAGSLLHEIQTPNSQDLLATWQDRVWNTDVSSLMGLGPVLDPVIRRCSSHFGHVARLREDTPAHQALRCHIDLSLGRLPDPSWRRCPGRPRNRWLDQHRSYGLARLASCNSTDTWIVTWGSTSSQNCCKMCCFKENVEKHCTL